MGRDCPCIITPHPEADGEFGPGSIVESITISPDCPVHRAYRYGDEA